MVPAFRSDRTSQWQIPPLDSSRGIATGTAAGIAREVGIDPVYVRALFFVLTVAGGWGIVLYGIAWLLMSSRSRWHEPYEPRPKGAGSASRSLGAAMVGFGLVLLTMAAGGLFEPALVWPLALVSGAIAVGLDRGQLEAKRLEELQRPESIRGRVVVGLLLFFAGVIAALWLSLSFWEAVRGVVVAGFVLAGAGIVFAPLLARLANDLLAERRMRIRSEERADMAAHLHDSVLQTLALIQKRSDDVGVVNLARRQERELRSWLFDDKLMHERLGFRSQLEQVMADVEDLHEVPIELVVVGDCSSSPDAEALLRAAREAATNAARHSGAPRIDVFAEVQAESIDVFVRDLGSGFDPAQVEADRVGIRDSIVRRMRRHGGSAVVTSTPGTGTEVELSMPRDATTQANDAASPETAGASDG